MAVDVLFAAVKLCARIAGRSQALMDGPKGKSHAFGF
jgi:hypothetical protein